MRHHSDTLETILSTERNQGRRLEEKLALVTMLTATDAGTGKMHESYDPDNPSKFTRKWFAWVDTLFAELVMSISPTQCPREPMPPLPPSIPTDPLEN